MPISFNSIPLDIRTFGQYIEIDNSRAVQGTPAQPHKALLIGTRLSTGTVAAAVPTLVPSAGAAEGYFGAGSYLAAMARAFKKNNPYTEMWAVALDEIGGGTKGTKTVTITGPATADGAIYLYIGGYRVTLAVASGDVQNTIATNLNAAIQAHPDYARMPMVSTVATNVVTLTAQHKGTSGNAVDVRVNYQQGEATAAGVTIVIATGVTGASDPSVATALTAIGDVQYNTIASQYNDDTNLELLGNELDDRWGPMRQQEGQAFAAMPGTQGTLTTAGNGLNWPFVTLFEIGGSGGNSPTPHWEAAGAVAGVDAFETGVDPARPRQTLQLKGVLAPIEQHRFTRAERQTLLTDGIATHYVDGSGTVRIERLITTYQTNPLSIPDPSYLDVTTMRTLAYLRYAVRSRIALKYPRHKLANDDTLVDPGQAVVTPGTIRAELISLFRDWERAGLVENVEQFKTDLIVERDLNDPNRVNARLSPDLINQFIVFAGQIQFLL